jgi:hypothetical protein
MTLPFAVMQFPPPESASSRIGTALLPLLPVALAALAALAGAAALTAAAPTMKVEPDRIRLGRWPCPAVRWLDLDSIRMTVVGRSVQLALVARPHVRPRRGFLGLRRWPQGQAIVKHRIPRPWVDPAELDLVLRTYAPPRLFVSS